MTGTNRRAASLFPLLLALIACVDDRSSSGLADERRTGQCFSVHRVDGYSSAGVDRLLVHVGMRDRYEFETFGVCANLDFSQRIALRSRTGSSQVCEGWDVDLIVPSGTGPAERCRVRMIRKLTPEEVEGTRR